MRRALIALLFLTTLAHAGDLRRVSLREVDGKVPSDSIEIRGVGAGRFDPVLWQAGKLHLLPDVRSPLLEPRPGKFRNIYAPSVVQMNDGWEIYYGGWDGASTGNDRIYRVTTHDFLSFGARRMIVDHGEFEHVCNVSADRLSDDALTMVCTTYPNAKRLNKPAFFRSPDADSSRAAKRDDVIAIDRYPAYPGADVNGMNVLLREDGRFRLYFCNFNDGGKVFRASGNDGKRYTFESIALPDGDLVNDVKKFRIGDGSWYLMALHANTDRLWYALSRDGKTFSPQQVLCMRQGDADAFMVAVGLVVSGEQEKPGRRVLGILYGAGAVPTLNANRIFARWLQKRVVLTAGDELFESFCAIGPDAQFVKLPHAVNVPLELYAEDGATLIGRADARSFEPGRAYEIAVD